MDIHEHTQTASHRAVRPHALLIFAIFGCYKFKRFLLVEDAGVYTGQ